MRTVPEYAIIAMLLLSSCCPRMVAQLQLQTEYRDSLSIRDSIVYVQLPAEQSSSHLMPSDTSRLETSLAESEAWTDSTGLHHFLRNKARPWGVSVPVIVHSVTDRATVERAQVVTRTVEVAKPLTPWQNFRISLGNIAIFAALIYAAVFAVKKLK